MGDEKCLVPRPHQPNAIPHIIGHQQVSVARQCEACRATARFVAFTEETRKHISRLTCWATILKGALLLKAPALNAS